MKNEVTTTSDKLDQVTNHKIKLPSDVQQSMLALDEDLYTQVVHSPIYQEIRKARSDKELSTEEYNILMAAIISAQKREQLLINEINKSFISLLFSLKEGFVSAIRTPVIYSPIKKKKDEKKDSSFFERINNLINIQNLAIIGLLSLSGFSLHQEYEKKNLTGALNALKENNAAFGEERKRLKSDLKQKNDVYEEAMEKYTKSQLALSELQIKQENEAKLFDEKIKLKEKTIKDQKSEIKSYKEQSTKNTQDVTKQLQALNQKFESSKEKISEHEKQLEDKELKIKQLNNRIKFRTDELEQRNKQISQLTEKNEELYDKIQHFQYFESKFLLTYRALNDIEEYLPSWYETKPEGANKTEKRIELLKETLKSFERNKNDEDEDNI